jgi:N-acylneuraminate cytidylyltransferase
VINGQKIFAVIPARGGSKGIPGKNLRVLAGKPLLAWTIEAAQRSGSIDAVIVDTDDAEIAKVACDYGAVVPYIRPSSLADDKAMIADVLVHAIERVGREFQYLVLLQCTSPLRTVADIDAAVELCVRSGAASCVSVSECAKPPQWSLSLSSDRRIHPLLGWDGFLKRRQDLEKAYMPNGAVFVAQVPWFCKSRTFYASDTIAYVMPIERAADIDVERDFADVEARIVGIHSESSIGEA